MALIINLPEELETRLRREAARRNLSMEECALYMLVAKIQAMPQDVDGVEAERKQVESENKIVEGNG